MPRNQVFSYKRDELLEIWWLSWRNYKTLKVNNFISADFQTQVSIWFLISMKLCTRIIKKKGAKHRKYTKTYEERLPLDTFEHFVTISKVKLANIECFQSFMAEFSVFLIDKEHSCQFSEIWIRVTVCLFSNSAKGTNIVGPEEEIFEFQGLQIFGKWYFRKVHTWLKELDSF